LKQAYDVTQYMDLLVNNTDYTVIVATSGNYYSEGTAMDGALARLGIDTFFDGGGLWIINNGEMIQNFGGDDFLEYRNLGNSDLAVSSEAGISNIIIDRESLVKVENGVNIVVYDNLLDKVADSVGFDASLQYGAIK